jgi:hypothetical protein
MARTCEGVDAGGYPAYLDREGRFVETSPRIHAEIDKTMARWGFEPSALHGWSRRHQDPPSLEDRLDRCAGLAGISAGSAAGTPDGVSAPAQSPGVAAIPPVLGGWVPALF